VTAPNRNGYKAGWLVLFNTLAYAAFFSAVFVLSWLLASRPRLRLWFLLGASYFFYAQWDYRFLPLIFASSTIDYWLGLKIADAAEPKTRKRWLWLTLIVNLGALGTFKYLGFGLRSMQWMFSRFGIDVPSAALELALPVGISFFTFESMSYVIDVYRKEIEAHRNYVEYLTFVAFFPHLVAGPIVRPRDLLPQLARPAVWDEGAGSRALYQIAWGLLKKVAIADTLAVNLVDRVFDAPTQYSSLECYLAIVGYALQIYCDFSGYTDIAIGSAALLGIKFPKNFDSPYKAADIQDFWRRWHLSLSTWLKDYLYVPLGGNRKGPTRTLINLMLTMLLGGLWHGANWTFVAWGGLHGLALVAQRLWSKGVPNWRLPHWLGVLVTFHFVCLCWVFFRADDFRAAWTLLCQLAELTSFHTHLYSRILIVLAVGLVSHALPEAWYEQSVRRWSTLPALGQGAVLFVIALVLREMASAEAVPFVYFQF
jgi:D-alanyl-lipoteichoic acid acyltransferase DltB (MBOAT superfamily)